MKKTAMRPPRTPKGEPAKVTLRVQEQQIAALTSQCAYLSNDITLIIKERDELLKKFYDQDQLLVTIAEQETRIKILVDKTDYIEKRRMEFMEERNIANDKLREALADISGITQLLEMKDGLISEMESASSRMYGWQDCAREVFQNLAMVEK